MDPFLVVIFRRTDRTNSGIDSCNRYPLVVKKTGYPPFPNNLPIASVIIPTSKSLTTTWVNHLSTAMGQSRSRLVTSRGSGWRQIIVTRDLFLGRSLVRFGWRKESHIASFCQIDSDELSLANGIMFQLASPPCRRLPVPSKLSLPLSALRRQRAANLAIYEPNPRFLKKPHFTQQTEKY